MSGDLRHVTVTVTDEDGTSIVTTFPAVEGFKLNIEPVMSVPDRIELGAFSEQPFARLTAANFTITGKAVPERGPEIYVWQRNPAPAEDTSGGT